MEVLHQSTLQQWEFNIRRSLGNRDSRRLIAIEEKLQVRENDGQFCQLPCIGVQEIEIHR
jgi:hypothetical protein